MGHVLGIDAAWTVANPSGIALLTTDTNPPRVLQASPSFEDFVRKTKPDAWCGKYNSKASLTDVLVAAKAMGAGADMIDVIAVDMPIAQQPVRGRRYCDQLISRSFGARGCATHTPTASRPGKISDRFLHEAQEAGFSLVTAVSQRSERALLEVYPHVAVLELCNVGFRVPYKLSRRARYWPGASPGDRLKKIAESWEHIMRCLNERMLIDFAVDCTGKPLQFWKAWEDTIDAVVCCWVGLEWLAGRTRPYGDELAAIWVPEGTDLGQEVG
jgi:predicted RNase H-like nuclease